MSYNRIWKFIEPQKKRESVYEDRAGIVDDLEKEIDLMRRVFVSSRDAIKYKLYSIRHKIEAGEDVATEMIESIDWIGEMLDSVEIH